MRRAGIAGALTAMIGILALGSGTAFAVRTFTPEFGRCVKVAKGMNVAGYSDHGCTKETASGAKYEWLPGPGAKPGFTASASGVALTLQVAKGHAHPSVECSTATTAGEFTGPFGESLSLTLTGCRMGSATCQSAGAAAGEVAFAPLQGKLVISKDESFGVPLVQWSPQLGETLAAFECGGVSVVISHSILHPIKADKMVSSETERLSVYHIGTQEPECYEPCEAGEEPSTSIGGAPAVPSGLSMSGTQSNQEAIEADRYR